jgi:hypothetical protein
LAVLDSWKAARPPKSGKRYFGGLAVSGLSILGKIDLDGKLRDPDPGMLLTRKTGVRPDFDGKNPLFDRLVSSLANHDKHSLCGDGKVEDEEKDSPCAGHDE